ncbi:MAG: hypothetical protein AAGC65_10665 [Mucilaginibacter sp.]|uniref:hypothetical protein n=1 Tax=Mucilaginibacter sp. TaxID=1882438 RepID=UPI0031A9D715
MKKNCLFMLAVMLIAAACKRSEEITPSAPEISSTGNATAVQNASLVPVIVAGSKDHAGYVNAAGGSARFNQPYGIFVNTDGTLLVADQRNGAVRKILNGVVSTVIKNTQLVGISSLAAVKDGTLALNDQGTTVLVKGGMLNYISFPFCEHCNTGGLSKSAGGDFFWYVNNVYDGISGVSLEAIKPNGDPINGIGGVVAESDSALVFGTSMSTTLNDNKFITTDKGIYEITHSGALLNILTPSTFDGLTDIAANKDGTKLYLADKGDIKLVTRCTSCPTVLTVLATHVDATALALSNSEKVLFFTSAKHHTISKINLP